MHYAIIAAGEGSRLRQEGVSLPKPLVQIAGQPMLGRLIALFSSMGAESISVICNELYPEVVDYLAGVRKRLPMVRYVVRTTSSSMHSLDVLSEMIPEGRFCLTTVDTVFLPEQFRQFIASAETADRADGYFAVTPFVDDEKPLWVGVDASDGQEITGFYDHEKDLPKAMLRYVSGGIYCLDSRSAFPVLKECLKQGQSRMRNFQRALLKAGLRIDAHVFPKIMDIDHVEDIVKAEKWLQTMSKEN